MVPSVVPILDDVFQVDNLGQNEQGFLRGNLECPDLDERRADESLDGGSRCIADAQPANAPTRRELKFSSNNSFKTPQEVH